MTTSPTEPSESTLADPRVCWRGECRSGCYYTDRCSLGNTTHLTPTAARIAQLEADLAATKAKLAAVEALADDWVGQGIHRTACADMVRAALAIQPAPTVGKCVHVPPSPGQSMCQCKHQQIEMEYAARIAEAQRGE